MTLNQADELIAQWSDKQNLIEKNLQSFADLPAFAHLCERPPGDELMEKVSGTFAILRTYQAALDGVVEQAKQLREGLPRIMPSRQTLGEIERLLVGNSIQLGSSPTPPQRRELLRDVEQAEFVSPARLLEIMLDSFRFVRDSVLEVEAVEVNAAQSDRKAQSRLIEAKSLMSQLRTENDHAKKLMSDCQLKVDSLSAPAVLPASSDELAALDTWLGKLATLPSGPAEVGLTKWMDAASKLSTRDQHCADANEALLRERRELRGLFDALEAKAADCGKPTDTQLISLANEIRQMLACRPTPMAQVRDLVWRYHQRLG